MRHCVPVGALEDDAIPILIVEADGRVGFCNRAAGRVLGREPEEVHGQTCWQIVRVRTERGAPFGGPDCPVQQEARGGAVGVHSHTAVVRPPDGGAHLEMLSFHLALPADGRGRAPVLHLLRPLGEGSSARRSPAGPADAIEALSGRELEVLRLLAEGQGTTAVSRRLGISAVTVRNHVESILRKLGVHSRLDAVLLLLRADG